ncbi:MAG TPA: MerR family transcriptional regulator [Streptosporangiaceae bacterium]|jgi:hypothetical protein
MNSPPLPEPVLGVGALARRLGVPAPTLRTWERRYGIGPSGRSAGGHRRYTEDDVARVVLMRRLVLRGVPPGDAARAALAADVRGHGEAPAAPAPGAAEPPPIGAEGLVQAALALDGMTLADTIGDWVTRVGVVETWEALLAPALIAIGERYARFRDCVDAEHLLSEHALAALGAAAARRSAPVVTVRPALLACAEEEQHSLALHALAAALNDRGVATRVLGQRTPFATLRRAIARIGPAAVFVWAQTPETADTAAVADLPAQRPAPLLVLGGPGWDPRAVPAGACLAASLPDAIALITDATA